mmetsp:Transcript_211/g.448  ORF Transcript_211/g.448 Transcript_211/m.448 type:complete len:360 (-) Transcript_211:855-1934(-)
MRAAEFYSGIGGLHYSLLQACSEAEVVAAFDINLLANKVYEHNFGMKPGQYDIGRLKAAELDQLEADVWLLSPPCQPYTRQGLQLGSQDARAVSFINLLEKIDAMKCRPKFLLVENVVGFETSSTRFCLVDTLEKNGYVTQEYIVSPLDVGVPYSRTRYFCLAKLNPLQFKNRDLNGQITHGPPALGDPEEAQPLLHFLESGSGSDAGNDEHSEYSVKGATKDKYFDALDIVTPYSKRTCCFTKSYFKFAKGTGSILAVNAIPQRDEDSTGQGTVDQDGKVYVPICSESGNIEKIGNAETVKHLDLRYFTPREIANLHSFPQAFTFPPDITRKQRYALLGNSLSVAVVEHLLKYMFQGD